MTFWLFPLWTVLVGSLVAATLSRSRRTWQRLVLSVVSLALLTLVLLPVVGSTVQPHFPPDFGDFGALSVKLFVTAWWLLLARTIIIAGQSALGVDHQHHASRLATDLAAGAVYLGSGVAVVDLVFGVSVTGLLATSGIIAIVLGLALQNTLGDLFSGIAMGLDRPFMVDDVIWIEGSIEGRVVETSWRSTRIVTATNDIATVPNSVVAKSRLLNRSSPTDRHTGSVRVVLDPAVPPERAMEVLESAVFNASLLSATASATVNCVDLQGTGSAYEIGFSAPLVRFAQARSDLLQQVARHLRYAGVALAPQDGTVLVRAAPPDPGGILRDVHVLQALGEADRAELESGLVRHEGPAGHSIFTQGGTLASMFVIVRGAFEIVRDDGAGPRRLGTIGPGDYFGELALLTGQANSATVRALTPFAAFEVSKPTLAPLLRRNPDLLHAFEEGAAKAQALLDRTIAAQACETVAPNTRLVDRIRLFFGMGESTHGSRLAG